MFNGLAPHQRRRLVAKAGLAPRRAPFTDQLARLAAGVLYAAPAPRWVNQVNALDLGQAAKRRQRERGHGLGEVLAAGSEAAHVDARDVANGPAQQEMEPAAEDAVDAVEEKNDPDHVESFQ